MTLLVFLLKFSKAQNPFFEKINEDIPPRLRSTKNYNIGSNKNLDKNTTSNFQGLNMAPPNYNSKLSDQVWKSKIDVSLRRNSSHKISFLIWVKIIELLEELVAAKIKFYLALNHLATWLKNGKIMLEFQLDVKPTNFIILK